MTAQPLEPVPWVQAVGSPGCDKPWTHYCMSDMHRGAPDFDQARFEADIAAIEADNHCSVSIAGDLFQADTKMQKHGGIYGQVEDVDDASDYLFGQLARIAEKIAVITTGNHDQRLWHQGGSDPTYQLACRLGLDDRYVADNALVPIEVGVAPGSSKTKGGRRPILYMLMVYHGDANRSSRASLERAANDVPGCDAYVSGHTHDPNLFTLITKLPNRQQRLTVTQESLCMTSGGYQTGIMPKRKSNYARRANLRGRRLGMTRLIFAADRRHVAGVI